MNRYNLAVLTLCLILAGMSAWESDWNCLVVVVIGAAVVAAPIWATRDSGAGYDEQVMLIAILPLAALAALFIVNALFTLPDYYPLSIAMQSGACMAFGLMVAVFLNARSSFTLPRRWMVLFAVIFTCSLSSLYMVSTIYWMASTGFPLHNEDFTDTLENNVVNMMLMLPIAVTALTTAVYAPIVNAYLKRAGPLELARLRGGP